MVIQPKQQVLMLQSRDRAPEPVRLIIPDLAKTHRPCFSARDSRRLSCRCCRGRLRILTIHVQILIFLLFQHDGFYPSLLVVHTPTGGTFGLLLGVGSEFELLQATSMMTGEIQFLLSIETGRRIGDPNHERAYRCTFDLVWLTKASSDS